MLLHIRWLQDGQETDNPLLKPTTRLLTLLKPIPIIPTLSMIEILGNKMALDWHYQQTCVCRWTAPRDICMRHCILPNTPLQIRTDRPALEIVITVYSGHSLDDRGLAKTDESGVLYDVFGADQATKAALLSGQYSITTAFAPGTC